MACGVWFVDEWFKRIIFSTSILFLGFRCHSCHSLQAIPPLQSALSKYRSRRCASERSSSAVDLPSNDDLKINIYDNIFDFHTCNELRQLACHHSEQLGDDSSLFFRSGTDSADLSPLESILDVVLEKVLNDTTTRVVEYWSRQEYMNMDTHCDVNENMLEKQSVVRCPEWAHILYLMVQPNATAPTCILPNKKGGWGTSPYDDNDPTSLDVVVVPAVSGRLVRFPGNWMHAVPKPPHRWFLSKEDELLLRKQQQKEEYSDSIEDRIVRSVILFNLWSNDESPLPCSARQDNRFGAVPSGIVIEDDAYSLDYTPRTSSDDYGIVPFPPNLPIIPKENCKSSAISTYKVTEEMREKELRIRLMGNRQRRKYRHAVATVRTKGGKELWNALHEPTNPSYIQLRATNDGPVDVDTP